MMKTLKSTLTAALALATLAGCSPYSQTDESSYSELGDLACVNKSKCVTPTPANLAVKANLPNGLTQFTVSAGLGDFNLGGDCNEGGFTYNNISWELRVDGRSVRSSQGMGYTSTCVNGRFSIYINLAATTSDPVNRVGLGVNGGNRRLHQLNYWIEGRSTSNGARVSGLNSAATLNLVP